ncbi:MAG: erythromycin esterase family protein, partial [Atopobiaceae bacterium]|nr:erythromycin esterase family protein [Atopobiaceae bacterium]
MMRPRDGKPSLLRWIVRGALVVLVVVAAVFSHFGGFGTGPSANPAELAAYAQEIEDITVPEGIRIVALGEATHGNVEFQQLKLEVFEVLVERYGVRAFALEGDCGGCEAVNRYIHGGPGTAEDAAASIGFTFYRTDEMVELIEWMHDYN